MALPRDLDEPLAIEEDVGRPAPVTARDDDGYPLRELVECLRDSLDRVRGPEHPDLHRIDTEVARHGAHLREDRWTGNVVNVGDADGVLSRDRRDRGHAMHAAGGECLQI